MICPCAKRSLGSIDPAGGVYSSLVVLAAIGLLVGGVSWMSNR